MTNGTRVSCCVRCGWKDSRKDFFIAGRRLDTLSGDTLVDFANIWRHACCVCAFSYLELWSEFFSVVSLCCPVSFQQFPTVRFSDPRFWLLR